MLFDFKTLLLGTSSMGLFGILVGGLASADFGIVSKMQLKTLLGIPSEALSRMGQSEMARSYPGCLKILLAAGGAGLIAAGTVIFKTFLAHSNQPASQLGPLAAHRYGRHLCQPLSSLLKNDSNRVL